MAWIKFDRDETGLIPDQIKEYVARHVIRRAVKGLAKLPRCVTKSELLADAIADAFTFKYNPETPIIVNIGYLRSYVYTRYYWRMRKYIKWQKNEISYNNEKTNESIGGLDLKRYAFQDSLEDWRDQETETAEEKELSNLSKKIFSQWLKNEKNENRKTIFLEYLNGATKRDIARKHKKSAQYIGFMILQIENDLKVRYISNSPNKDFYTKPLRERGGEFAIIADYLDNPTSVWQLTRELKEFFQNPKFSPCMCFWKLKEGLNIACNW